MVVHGYPETVARVISGMLGEQAASAIFFYTGEPDDPAVFEPKLASIFGEGTPLILNRIHQELQEG